MYASAYKYATEVQHVMYLSLLESLALEIYNIQCTSMIHNYNTLQFLLVGAAKAIKDDS